MPLFFLRSSIGRWCLNSEVVLTFGRFGKTVVLGRWLPFADADRFPTCVDLAEREGFEASERKDARKLACQCCIVRAGQM